MLCISIKIKSSVGLSSYVQQKISSMQVYVVFALVIASVAAKGSGPYLPSGWRPDGPAFYLPSEVQQLADSPLQDVNLAGSEASGSDALREYGPPKIDLPSPIINQGLPDVAIEQNFIEAVFTSDGDKVSSIVLEKTIDNSKEISEVVVQQSEANTVLQENEGKLITAEAPLEQIIVEQISEKNLNSAIEAEAAEIAQLDLTTLQPIVEEEQEAVSEQEVSAAQEVRAELEASTGFEVSAEQDVNIESEIKAEDIITEQAVRTEQEATTEQQVLAQQQIRTEEEVIAERGASIQVEQDITESLEKVEIPLKESTTDAADARSEAVIETQEEISNLENIVQTIPAVIADLESAVKAEVENKQAASDSSSQGTSLSSQQVPEGFLEYGPPGFKEYGPPKEDLNTEAIQGLLRQASVETNEARRRRFSPKFKPAKKSH